MMRFFIFILLISICWVNPLFSQRKTKLNTHGNGTLFAQIGYNRSGYLPSNIKIASSNYDVSLERVALTDNINENKMSSFFSDDSPQLSVKLGYFVADHWAITGSWDRYNTFFKNQQNVLLKGNFSEGSNSLWVGNINEEILINRSDFHISQRTGMNVFSLGVQRNDMLGRTKAAEFAIHTLYGLRFGAIQTRVDYTYDDRTSQNLSSFGGFAIMADVGVRLDFFQYVYLQIGLNGGLLNQGKIKLSKDETTTGKQSTAFLAPTLSLGVSIFANSKNNCATCPSW